MKRMFAVLLSFAFIASTCASADEGMWLYNAPPKDKIKAKYGFELTQAVARPCSFVFRAV